MTADANVTNEATPLSPAAPATGSAPAPQQRVWSMPTSPVTRKHVDDLGRTAVKVAASVGAFVARSARYGAGVVRRMWRQAQAVPPAVRLFSGAGLLMLLGIAGAIALDNSLGLLCTVVVVPVCSAVLGALGYRWYSGLGIEQSEQSEQSERAEPGRDSGRDSGRTDSRPVRPADSDLQRSVQYVDRKLAVALTSFGTEHHQQAVIALFQAKTAVELTLGTEQDLASYADMTLRPDDYGLRPRIRSGSGSGSAPREGNSLAAS
ncbi:hypothetical protein ACNUDN_21210 [Mycobacterium sp. smrl_JER01]|uniref:hypothetical protein n=1 Tax=Mycobacterium sp. smrl_JER01 TaxID=3402633 RepID=UPI003AD73276